ncbi:hypothetical protein Tco_0385267 [Tanacetum coccineum]
MVTYVEEDDGPLFDEYDDEHEKMTSDQEETTYAYTGKICNVIKDGGRCENVVSETMVSKLGLKTEQHP